MNKDRILVIDDEAEICLNIKAIFEYEDYEADCATTAKEALQKINEKEYGLILVDIKLEGRVSGIEIIRGFREKEKRPKIIVISATPSDALNPIFEREEVADLIDGFIDKPGCGNPEKLIGLIKRVLR